MIWASRRKMKKEHQSARHGGNSVNRVGTNRGQDHSDNKQEERHRLGGVHPSKKKKVTQQ